MEGIEREKDPALPTAEATALALKQGSLTVEEALGTFWKIDQSFTDTPGVLRALEDPEVEEAFLRTEEAANYYNLLSVAALHEGKRLVLAGEDPLLYFEKSLEAARKLLPYRPDHYPDSADWVGYIEAHCAYFKNDTKRLGQILEDMAENYMNRQSVELLYKGLQARGAPDYLTDLHPLM